MILNFTPNYPTIADIKLLLYILLFIGIAIFCAWLTEKSYKDGRKKK